MNILYIFAEALVIEILVLILLLVYFRKKKRDPHKFEIVISKPKEIKQEKKQEKKKPSINIKKWFNSLIPRKPEQWFIVCIYAVVLGIFAYFLIGNLFPGKVPVLENNFIISAGSLQIFDKLSSFYIDKDNVLGKKETLDNTAVRKITSAEAFNLIMKPKTPIKNDFPATLEINLMMNNSNAGTGTDIYMNDKPIIPDLSNYELLKEFEDEHEAVYISKSLSSSYNKELLIKGNSAQEFVYKNFPGVSVYSFSNAQNYVPNLEDYKPVWTSLDGTFRGDLKLAVYAKGNLQISFIKQDLNGNLGRDEYIVEIKDLAGKSYFTKLYEDDRDYSKSGKLGAEQNFKISVDNLPMGIYYITFTKDKYNSAPDSTIKEIKLNSNKALISGTFLPWSANFEVYTKVSTLKKIGFNYWWKDKNQTIAISGEEKISLKLDEDWLSKTREVNLTKLGDYNINSPKGYLWVYSDIVSLNKNSWFNIPMKNEGNLKSQGIIIIDKNKLKINGSKVQYLEDIKVNKDTKFKLQVINENKVYLDSIKLNLK